MRAVLHHGPGIGEEGLRDVTTECGEAPDRNKQHKERDAQQHAGDVRYGCEGSHEARVRKAGKTAEPEDKIRSFPRKLESREKDWVPAFAGTSGDLFFS